MNFQKLKTTMTSIRRIKKLWKMRARKRRKFLKRNRGKLSGEEYLKEYRKHFDEQKFRRMMKGEFRWTHNPVRNMNLLRFTYGSIPPEAQVSSKAFDRWVRTGSASPGLSCAYDPYEF